MQSEQAPKTLMGGFPHSLVEEKKISMFLNIYLSPVVEIIKKKRDIVTTRDQHTTDAPNNI